MSWPTVKVELGAGVDPTDSFLVLDDPDRGLLDVGQLAPDDGVWTDLTATINVSSIEVTRGRRRLLEAYSRGQMTVVFDDLDATLTPFNTSSDLYPYVRPETRIRATLTHNAVEYPLFLGFIDSVLPQLPRVDGGSRTCTIRATDAFKVLARFDPAAASSPDGAGETTGERVARVLDNMAWPGGDRALHDGLSTVQATTLAQNALTECQLAADSEYGELFVDAEGKIVFRDRHSRWERTESQVVQATFTDANTAGALHYESLDVPALDAELVKNRVSIAAVGGAAAVSTDATSRATYFERTWNRHDLVFDGGDAESQQYADQVVFFHKDPEQRVDGIRLKAHGSSPNALWAAMYGLGFGDQVRAVRTLTGDDLDDYLFVEGVQHTIRAQGRTFETTLQTSSAAKFVAGIFILDSATLGVLDQNTLAASY